jgi:predicted O-methyltransferase YrrM
MEITEWLKGKRIPFFAAAVALLWAIPSYLIDNSFFSGAWFVFIIVWLLVILFTELRRDRTKRVLQSWRREEGWHNVRLLLPSITYIPPQTTFSLAPDAAAYVLRTINREKPATIVELGCGLSTVLISTLIKQNNLPVRFYSVESDADYLAQCREILEDNGTADVVEFLHAPLKPLEVQGESYSWYQPSAPWPDAIDLLLVDGPPKVKGTLSRLPAIPVLSPYFSDNLIVIADDADRQDIKDTVEQWAKALEGSNPDYIELSRTIAVIKCRKNG